MPGHYILYEIILVVLYSDKAGTEGVTCMLQMKHSKKDDNQNVTDTS